MESSPVGRLLPLRGCRAGPYPAQPSCEICTQERLCRGVPSVQIPLATARFASCPVGPGCGRVLVSVTRVGGLLQNQSSAPTREGAPRCRFVATFSLFAPGPLFLRCARLWRGRRRPPLSSGLAAASTYAQHLEATVELADTSYL